MAHAMRPFTPNELRDIAARARAAADQLHNHGLPNDLTAFDYDAFATYALKLANHLDEGREGPGWDEA